MTQRILRPLEYGSLFDELFDLYKQNFLLFAGIAGIVYIPAFGLTYRWALSSMAGLQGMKPGTATRVSEQVLMHSMVQFFTALGLLILVGLLAYALVRAAMTWAISRRYLGEPATILGAFKAVGAKSLVLSLMILAGVVIFYIGLALCIIPGVVIGVLFAFWFAFLVPVYVLEGRTMRDAMARSRALAAGNWGRIFVVGLLAGVIAGIVQRVIIYPFTLVVPDIGHAFSGISPQAATIYGLVVGLSGALTTPISALALTLLYYDVRVRREGFDVEMLARSLGRPAPDAATPPLT